MTHVMDPRRLEELKRKDPKTQKHSDEKRRIISREEKEMMPVWMSEDEEGIFNYVIFKIYNPDTSMYDYFAIDDDYLDPTSSAIIPVSRVSITRSPVGYVALIKGEDIRHLVNLPGQLGYDEKPSKDSFLLNLEPKVFLGENIALVINSMPEERQFERPEIMNPRDHGDNSFPVYVPRIIEADVGQIRILSLEALLIKGYDNSRETAHAESGEDEGKF